MRRTLTRSLLAAAFLLAPGVAAQDFVTSPLEPLAEAERSVSTEDATDHETVLDPQNTLLGIALSRASGVPLGVLDVGNVTLDRSASGSAEQDVLIPLSNVFPALSLGVRSPPGSIHGLLDSTNRVTQSVEADLPVDLDPDTVRLALALYANGFAFSPQAAILRDDRVAGVGEVVDLEGAEDAEARIARLPVQNAFAASALGMEQIRPVTAAELVDVRASNEEATSYLYVPRLTEGAVLAGIILRNHGLPAGAEDVIGREYDAVGATAADKTAMLPIEDVFAALVVGARGEAA